MTSLPRLAGFFSIFIGAVVALESPQERWKSFGVMLAGVAAFLVARAIDRHARYRRAFARARQGARKVAREAGRGGGTRYVPRPRWRIRLRRMVPGRAEQAERSRRRIEEVVRPHVPALATKRERLVRREYGREERSGWEKELALFLERVVLAEIPEPDLDRAVPFVYRWYPGVEQDDARATRYGTWGRRMYCRPEGTLAEMVEVLVEEYVDSAPYQTAAVEVADLTPDQYELHCARLLRECGWDAEVVGGSGDQGADILASLSGLRVAIQCKRYARPVGNGAVQEVIAGRHMFDAHAGVVVSPTPFTKAAHELAAKTRILLLHHTELHCLEDRLREAGVAPGARQSPRPDSQRLTGQGRGTVTS